MFIAELAILVYSVILHEIAHGFVANRLGDPTARLHKRLTLNPIPHIDLWLTILLPLMLIVTHSPILFGGAKPVPIDPYNFRDVKKDTALTALAGPATNLAIALTFALLIRFADVVIIADAARFTTQEFFTRGVILNVSLAIFNLFPIPPLDGSKVLAGILPDNLANELLKLERFGFLIVFAALFFFPGLIFGIIGPIINNISTLLLR